MNKYKQKLLENVRGQLREWFEKKKIVPNEELERFLHSLAGTAKTLGLNELGNHASTQLDSLTDQQKEHWNSSELQKYLIPIIRITYSEELVDLEINNETERANICGKPVILIVDDETSLLMYLKETLEEEGYQVFLAASHEKALSLFYEIKPDCFILDIHMKDWNGLNTLAQLQEKLQQLFIPTVVMSDHNESDTRIKAFELGADDFIAKPFDIKEFKIRVKRQLERKRHIESVLLLDELTQIFNRKYLEQSFVQLHAELNRAGNPFCLVMLDIDHFKKVNDTYGHITGDEVLKQFATFVKGNIRINDVFARFGGEEFTLLLPNTQREDGVALIQRILDGFSKEVFHASGSTFSCTFSAGIVEVEQNNKSISFWIEKADQALYEAKYTGRNKISISNHELNRQLQPLKIAVVDDDPIIRSMLTQVLSKISPPRHHVIELKAFSDGLTFLQSEWIADACDFVVVLDGMMPKMDGLEVLQRLRQEKRHDKFSVMMLTTRKSESDIKRALQLGADDYMTKPFKLVEIESRVQRLLNKVTS